MKGCGDVIEYLNKALRHELTAVNQYLLHGRLFKNWGFTKLAAVEKAEALEERDHADKIIERILFLEGYPNLQVLDPLKIGTSLKDCIECDLAAEYAARALYHEARQVCRQANDMVSMRLFETLLVDEESHIDFLETELKLIEQIGIERYGLLQAGAA